MLLVEHPVFQRVDDVVTFVDRWKERVNDCVHDQVEQLARRRLARRLPRTIQYAIVGVARVAHTDKEVAAHEQADRAQRKLAVIDGKNVLKYVEEILVCLFALHALIVAAAVFNVQRMQPVLSCQLIQFWIVRVVERVPGQSSLASSFLAILQTP
jgi:hypothetical protein